ncbi:hypothetical protein SAMN05216344_11257 [Polaromonas sp. OV174]|nr:hypothetical protein SAMN05216344_11257 [Polaromonas sp. OV174]
MGELLQDNVKNYCNTNYKTISLLPTRAGENGGHRCDGAECYCFNSCLRCSSKRYRPFFFKLFRKRDQLQQSASAIDPMASATLIAARYVGYKGWMCTALAKACSFTVSAL